MSIISGSLFPRIILTTGEPAGIGPDITVQLAQQDLNCQLVVIADPELLKQRAAALQSPISISLWQPSQTLNSHQRNHLWVWPVALNTHCTAGKLDPRNAHYVLQMLQLACDACLTDRFDALVTAPIHKGVINDAGHPFTGHTEFFAEQSHTAHVVMMLQAHELRVALATTHLPLRDVPAAITAESLQTTLNILHRELQNKFEIHQPRIVIAGLNPHAGESGHLGNEEIDVMIPVIKKLQQQGLSLVGPLPADTLFTPHYLKNCDAVLAMYHDQGLPVLKHYGFGHAVNITLGLPFIRTSVDHGTALDKAGTRAADHSSLVVAINSAIELASHRRGH